MPVLIASMPPDARPPRSRARLYDFAGWFAGPRGDDGRVRFVLRRGVHYDCSQGSMSQQLRIAATHCGVRVSVVDLEDGLSVAVAPKAV